MNRLTPVRRNSCFLVALVVLAIVATALPSGSARAVSLRVEVQDTASNPILARMQIRNANGLQVPGVPDSSLMSHDGVWMRGYFYPTGPVTFDLPAGNTRIVVGRGFEWRPVLLTVPLLRDTTVVVQLEHVQDMRALGWFCGDNHVHSNHQPYDYLVTPSKLLRITQAEDLAMCWALDQAHQFTGGPHAVSTAENILYFSTEFRNQAYGHVAMLGLKQLMGESCCVPPSPASPMLSDLYEEWTPGWDEAMSLNHPLTGAGFFDDGGWPALSVSMESEGLSPGF